MKFRQAAIFAVCILSIFSMMAVLHVGKASINAAASGQLGLTIVSTAYSQPACGNGICETGENCAVDCTLSDGTAAPPATDNGKNISSIKFTTFLLILLIMILCVLAYLYLREDRHERGYWQYGV